MDNQASGRGKGKSLNKTRRKEKLQEITKANMKILARIQGKESTYNHLKWEEERRINEQYINNISFYGKRRRRPKAGRLKPMDESYVEGARSRAGGRVPYPEEDDYNYNDDDDFDRYDER